MPRLGDDADWDRYLPEAVMSRHSLEDLPEQFVCAEREAGPATWPEHRLGSWVLRRHSTLRVVSLRRRSDRRRLGWLLGYAITPAGHLLADGDDVTVSSGTVGDIQEALDPMGGRWATLVVAGEEPHVRLDPAGSLSVVYDPTRRFIASTPNLIPYAPGYEDDEDLVRAFRIPWVEDDRYYPLTLTPRRGVVRLLPNHVLDLSDFRARRTWPTGDIEIDNDVSESVQRISELVKTNVGALVSDARCALALTSGQDSRMILACARDWAPELTLYTIHYYGWLARTDARVAQRVARLASMDHMIVPHVEPSVADLDEYLFRVSCSISNPRGWRAASMYKTMDRRLTRLVGAVGEVGRAGWWPDVWKASWWRTDASEDSALTPERLLAFEGIPVTEQTRAVVVDWLETVPTTDAFTTLNLHYLEDRVGCWHGLYPYAEYAGPGFTIFPMNHAEIIRRMLALPRDVQRASELPKLVIAREWPELLSLPFERDVGLQRIHLLSRWYGGARRRLRAAYAARRR